MIEKLLTKRLFALEKNTEQIRQRMSKYPQGHLKINMEKGGYYYRIVDKKTGKREYVRKDDIDKARIIAQRDYELNYLKVAENEINEIKKIFSDKVFDRTKDCYSTLHAGRKCLVKPLEISDEEYVIRWMNIPYTPKGFTENDNTEYYTAKGERVRSKSEIIIADTLDYLNIPYKYECPLKLGNITVYPDFTIFDVMERREKYLEHFGIMGDSDYVSDMMLKVSTYEKNGIYLGDSLICTFESAKRPLNVNVLRSKIATLILRH